MVSSSHLNSALALIRLLQDYSFEAGDVALEAVVARWLTDYEPLWIGYAITEALYQGRYKLVSVEHILQMWQRRGQPLHHFSREFETIVLGSAILGLLEQTSEAIPLASQVSAPEPPLASPVVDRPEAVDGSSSLPGLDAPPPIPTFVPHVDVPLPAYQRLQGVASRSVQEGVGDS